MILYKFRSLHGEGADGDCCRKRILDIVNDSLLYCSRWRKFSDVDEGSYLSLSNIPLDEIPELGLLSGTDRAEKIKEMKWLSRCNERLRVCSLSKGPLCNEDMWREYGDEHRGVAIEFKVLGEGLPPPLYEVTYESDEERSCRYRNVFQVLNSAGGDIARFSEAVLRWKGRGYAFEREVRLICRQDELTVLKYPDCCKDELDRACYRLEMSESGDFSLYDFRKLLRVDRVWCGRDITKDDRLFLESNVRGVEILTEPSCGLDEACGLYGCC